MTCSCQNIASQRIVEAEFFRDDVAFTAIVSKELFDPQRFYILFNFATEGRTFQFFLRKSTMPAPGCYPLNIINTPAHGITAQIYEVTGLNEMQIKALQQQSIGQRAAYETYKSPLETLVHRIKCMQTTGGTTSLVNDALVKSVTSSQVQQWPGDLFGFYCMDFFSGQHIRGSFELATVGELENFGRIHIRCNNFNIMA